jgi:peptide/nickel transport system substrate-binding protein
LLPAGVASVLAQALSEPEALARAGEFADQVVRVIPERADGAPTGAGFGLIVGERGGKVYIATPSHVVFGQDRPSLLNSTPVVVFRGSRYDKIPARRLEVASAQDDLAVVEAVPPQGLALPHAPIAPAAQLRRGSWVWNIGIAQDWDMPDRAGGLGPVDVVTGLRRIGQLRTPPGASGGAGVTERGVIGIVLQDATDSSWLLPVERIIELFTAWDLPVNLLISPQAVSSTEVGTPSGPGALASPLVASSPSVASAPLQAVGQCGARTSRKQTSGSRDGVTIGMLLEPPSLDPTTAPAAAIGEVTHYNIFEGLTKFNEDFSVTPLLAEKWSSSPDFKTLTFTLCPNVKFQDGEPFSSKDVKFSFERFAAQDSTNKDKGFFASIQSIDTPDPMTVVLNFKDPSFEALYHLGTDTSVIIDEKSAATEATAPVGTGPYKLASWTKGASITLDKWDGYRDPGKIAIAHATFRFISDRSAAVASLLAGDVDAFPRFPVIEELGQFQSDPRFQVMIGGTEGKTILAMNNKRKPLDDVRVRRAIAYAIDRNAIIGGAMSGLGAPIGSHLTPNDPGYVDLTQVYQHNPTKAKALLREAGVSTPLQLNLILPPPAYARDGGKIIAAQLAEVGINAKIENVEWAQWLSGVYKDKNYDLTIISHVEPLDIGIYANPDYYYQYDSQAFRDIYAKVAAAPDLAAFKEALGAAQRKIVEDSVDAFLFQLPNVTVADAKLQGLWKNAPIFVNDLSAMSWK